MVPFASTAIPVPRSSPLPPRKVEYVPVVLAVGIKAAKASVVPPPKLLFGRAFTLGKSLDLVEPVTCAFWFGSTAMASPVSSSVPPKYEK